MNLNEPVSPNNQIKFANHTISRYSLGSKINCDINDAKLSQYLLPTVQRGSFECIKLSSCLGHLWDKPGTNGVVPVLREDLDPSPCLSR